MDTHELAADVRAKIGWPNHETRVAAHAALDALVARVTDLEAQVAQRDAAIRDLLRQKDAWECGKAAAEAQLAALTQERDKWRGNAETWHRTAIERAERIEAAEAALASTRQALEQIVALYDSTVEPFTTEAAYADIARRALAATEEQT